MWATIMAICSSYLPPVACLGELALDDHGDLVVDLQGAEERRVGLDAPVALLEVGAAGDGAAALVDVERDRLGLAAHLEVAADLQAVAGGLDAGGLKGDVLLLEH